MKYSGPPAAPGPIGRQASITKHLAKPVPRGHNGTVGRHYGVNGTRFSNLSQDGMGLATCDLIKRFAVKRHHFAAHVVVLMAAVLEQAIQN